MYNKYNFFIKILSLYNICIVSLEKNVPVVAVTKYNEYINQERDAEGFFKHVYFTPDKVVLIFQYSTASQIVHEISSLLQLRGQEHIGRIDELIHDERGEMIIGLTMKRYSMTLDTYLQSHSRRRLSPQKRMHLIIQMIQSIQESHQLSIAHRDLSTLNYMIDLKNKDDEPQLYLIDFGKAVFYDPQAAMEWWVATEDDIRLRGLDLRPQTKEELDEWCKKLPECPARSNHGYLRSRSIQTLPRSNKDTELLPYLINPAAEDIYSLGTIIWETIQGMVPWFGISDLETLRVTVDTDLNIDDMLEKIMSGPTSIRFLKMFLRVNADDRKSANEILTWIQQPEVQNALIKEWKLPRKGIRRSGRIAANSRRKATANPAGNPTARSSKGITKKVTTSNNNKKANDRGAIDGK